MENRIHKLLIVLLAMIMLLTSIPLYFSSKVFSVFLLTVSTSFTNATKGQLLN